MMDSRKPSGEANVSQSYKFVKKKKKTVKKAKLKPKKNKRRSKESMSKEMFPLQHRWALEKELS